MMGASASKRPRKEPAAKVAKGGNQGNVVSPLPLTRVEGASQSLLSQPALWVGHPSSHCEQEADYWSERAMRPSYHGTVPALLSCPQGNAVRSPAIRSLLSGRGPGTPLSAEHRTFFERRLGRDLSTVRLHNDACADTMNQALHSKAFTYGQSIFFAAGALDPHTRIGQALLAHELVHSLQQGQSATPIIQRQLHDHEAPALPEVELRALDRHTRLVLVGGVRIGVLRTEGQDFSDSVQVFSQSGSMRMAGADPLETEPEVHLHLVRPEGVRIEFRERSGWQDVLIQSRRWRGRLGGVRFFLQQSADPPEWSTGTPLQATISRPETTDAESLRSRLEDVEEELDDLRTRVSLQQLVQLPNIDYRWYRPRLHPRRGFLAYIASLFVNDVYAGSVRIEVNDRRYHLQRITPDRLVRFEEEVSAGAVEGRDRPLLSRARIRVLHSPAVTVSYRPERGSRLVTYRNLILDAGVGDFDVQIVEDTSQDWPEAYTDEYLEEVWGELGPDRFVEMAAGVYERRLRRFDQTQIERQEDQIFFPAGRYEALFEPGGSGPSMVSAMRRRLLAIRHNERMSETERLREMYALYLDYMSGDEGLRQTLSTLWAMEFATVAATPAGAGIRGPAGRAGGTTEAAPAEAPVGGRVVEAPVTEAVAAPEATVGEPAAPRVVEAPAATEAAPVEAETAGPPRSPFQLRTGRTRASRSRALRLALELTMEGMRGGNEVVTPDFGGGPRGAPAETSAPAIETPSVAEPAPLVEAPTSGAATRPGAGAASEATSGVAPAEATAAPVAEAPATGEAPAAGEAMVSEGGAAPSPESVEAAPVVSPGAVVEAPGETVETAPQEAEAQAEDTRGMDISFIQRWHELADALQDHQVLGETAAELRRVTAELLDLIELRQVISEEIAELQGELRGLRRGSAERQRVEAELVQNQGQLTVSRSRVQQLHRSASELATLLERGLEGPARRGPNYRALQAGVREDQVFETGRTHTLSIDHIVTVSEIMRMEGFARLVAQDWEAAMSILDFAENLVVMPLSANSSRGNQTWRQWRGWLPIVTSQPALWQRVQQEYTAREDRLRSQIQDAILRLLRRR